MGYPGGLTWAALASAVLMAASLPARADSGYHWPLDLPRKITSSFAEYRPGRFHAGVDLRTRAIGPAVYAARDGYVSRLRCSPWGYGKAVYLELDNGYTAVYAHLDAFAEPLAAYVRTRQHANESYTIDVHLEPGEIPVQAGQRIASSGRTGTVTPHLHYELRDTANRPVNPRLLGLDWPDPTRPLIKQVLVAPEGPGSLLDGDCEPLVLPVTATGPGTYTSRPVRASGRIGFGAEVIDPANEGANRLGVHVLRAASEGQEIFRMQHDRLSYADIRSGAVAYHPFFLDQGRFLLAWRWPGNASASYSRSPSAGWFEMPPERTAVTLEAIDFHGNTAEVTIPLIPIEPGSRPATATSPARGQRPGTWGSMPVLEPSPESSGSASTEPAKGTAGIRVFGTWFTVTAAFDASPELAPELVFHGDPPVTTTGFMRIDDRTYRAACQPAGFSGTLRMEVRHPGIPEGAHILHAYERGPGPFTDHYGPVHASIPSNAPYGMLYLATETLDSPPGTLPATPLGDAFQIGPSESSIDEPITLSFPLPAGARPSSRVHIYRFNGNGWSSMDTARTGNRLEITTRSLGTFMAGEDSTPPRIWDAEPAGGAVSTRRPHIRAKVHDAGSGVDSIRVTCGGQWLLTAYDPQEGRIAWERDEDLPPGEQTLVLRVEDKAGNAATVSRTVVVPD